MIKRSAGILLYRKGEKGLEIFLGHPGGPFWKNKEEGIWGIPKGLIEEGENELNCALREFNEETGISITKERTLLDLGQVRQQSGKIVYIWAVEEKEGDWSGLLMGKSYVDLEYPYKSGKMIKFPELDKAGFFSLEKARKLIRKSQLEFLERLNEKII